jgi:hypothetical protein
MCIYVYLYCCSKRKMEAQVIFFNPYTLCSSCKRKFVICLCVDEETNRSYLFASGLNRLSGLNGLANLCLMYRSNGYIPLNNSTIAL